MNNKDLSIKTWLETNSNELVKVIDGLEKIKIEIGLGNHKEDIKNCVDRAKESYMWLSKIINEMAWGK
jgi:hypothetical protein